ncbi:MAG: hypothetical protein ED557_09745 [Balneola sp.]|nr:MAG: hypothetical protein ED557_09745 [Balneola sp.]
MLKLEETKLETYSFNDDGSDEFYILIDIKKNPEGINLTKLAMADPRRFDAVLNEMGCLLMLGEDEIKELTSRGALDPRNLHESLFSLAKTEGIL